VDTEYTADKFDCVRDIRDNDPETIEAGKRIFALCDKITETARGCDASVPDYISALATNIMDTSITLSKLSQLITVNMLRQMADRLEMNANKL